MIKDHRRYPVYKPSGIPWLDNLPEHWELARIKSIGCIRYGLGQPPRESASGLPLIRATNISSGRILEKDLLRVDPIDVPVGRDAFLREKEIIVVRSGAYTADSAIVPEKYAGAVAGYDMVLTVKKAMPEFIALTLLTSYLKADQLIVESTRAAQPHLNAEELGKSAVLLPPLNEQAIIVRYLDQADERIQAYISAKEKLIALLEEQRQAVIHQAVTRGLDPNVKLNPSGVEWLGEVPEHWEVRRMKTLGEALIGLTYSPNDVVEPEEGTLVLRASNIFDREIVDADNVYVRCQIPEKLIAKTGDILICSRSGSRNLIGKNAQIDVNSAGASFGAFMTLLRGPNNNYLHQILNSNIFKHQSGSFMTSTINQLTLGMLNDMQIPFPPAEEQHAIMRYLSKKTRNMESVIRSARHQIELMQEYRTRLIADVVTGKLDVRKAAEDLPQLEPTDMTN